MAEVNNNMYLSFDTDAQFPDSDLRLLQPDSIEKESQDDSDFVFAEPEKLTDDAGNSVRAVYAAKLKQDLAGTSAGKPIFRPSGKPSDDDDDDSAANNVEQLHAADDQNFHPSDSRHIPIEKALPIGTILFNKYTIKGIIGNGGFSFTYKCTCDAIDGFVTVKEYYPKKFAKRNEKGYVLPFSMDDMPLFKREQQRFLNEAKVMTKLKQEMLPHIVSLIDVFEEKNTAYIVEDYIDGITLNEYMKQHTVFSAKQITAIIKPVLKSMVKIHNMGLIHRDISPDNLMITRDYAIYLIDFGSACYWENLDKDDTILVKPGFTPPESYVHDQVSGPWSDIYSMAATMFYAMAGRAPVESIKRTDDTYFDYLLSVCKDLTNFQIRALQGGLMLDPEKRYRKMEDFMSMLYNINNVYEESLEGKSKNKILKIFNKN